eukprot:10625062-Prorocentrum_lima.AAC.1
MHKNFVMRPARYGATCTSVIRSLHMGTEGRALFSFLIWGRVWCIGTSTCRWSRVLMPEKRCRVPGFGNS